MAQQTAESHEGNKRQFLFSMRLIVSPNSGAGFGTLFCMLQNRLLGGHRARPLAPLSMCRTILPYSNE